MYEFLGKSGGRGSEKGGGDERVKEKIEIGEGGF